MHIWETQRGDTLRKAQWEHPSDYAGFNPVGDIVVLSRHRDSDALTRSNWEVGLEQLRKAAESAPESVYDWRASHWAVGWVDYLMVKRDAPESVLEAAAEILDSLAGYPALDDEHWSDLEWQENADYWASLDVRDRADIIRRSGSTASIFAARRDEIPDDNGYVYDWLRG
jgi:hypothetical protein